MERAEYLVDQLGVTLGRWADTAGDRLQRLWARTREESEDIWAEAQDIRHRTAVGIGPAGRASDEAGAGGAAESPEAEPAAKSRSRKHKKTTDVAS
jgi:hypothetical protein